jgi:hypothetical protein
MLLALLVLGGVVAEPTKGASPPALKKGGKSGGGGQGTEGPFHPARNPCLACWDLSCAAKGLQVEEGGMTGTRAVEVGAEWACEVLPRPSNPAFTLSTLSTSSQARRCFIFDGVHRVRDRVRSQPSHIFQAASLGIGSGDTATPALLHGKPKPLATTGGHHGTLAS